MRTIAVVTDRDWKEYRSISCAQAVLGLSFTGMSLCKSPASCLRTPGSFLVLEPAVQEASKSRNAGLLGDSGGSILTGFLCSMMHFPQEDCTAPITHRLGAEVITVLQMCSHWHLHALLKLSTCLQQALKAASSCCQVARPSSLVVLKKSVNSSRPGLGTR